MHTWFWHMQSSSLSFAHLTDEPESKKLAAQSDLDSATALCEFHPIMLWSVYFLLRDVYNPQLTFPVVQYSCFSSLPFYPCLSTLPVLCLCHILISQSISNPNPLPCSVFSLSLSFCCCPISAIGAQLAALAHQRWDFSLDCVLCRSIGSFVANTQLESCVTCCCLFVILACWWCQARLFHRGVQCSRQHGGTQWVQTKSFFSTYWCHSDPFLW